MKKLTTDEFISKAISVHGDEYDYSKTVYINKRTKVIITCKKHGDYYQYPLDHLKGHKCKLCANDYNKSRIKNVAINDLDLAHGTDCYSHWIQIIRRIYDEKWKTKNQSYIDCTVCEEWLYLSNFKKWFDDPINGYKEGYEIDKDILIKGNKMYSPDTCCFVPQEINKLLLLNKHKRSSTPIGVNIKNNKYVARLSKRRKRVFIGSYDDKEEAFNAYKTAKEQYVKELADKYYKEGKITKKVYDALMKYEVEITD